MVQNPLLFFAAFELHNEDKTLFEDNYALHMRKKLHVPGFLFGYHYLDQSNPNRIVCLYGIEDIRFLSSLFAKKIDQRHPFLQLQSASQLLFDFAWLTMGIYQLKTALPNEQDLWFSDLGNLHIELWEWQKKDHTEMLGFKFDQLYLDKILNLPSQNRAYRFEKYQSPVIDYLNTSQKNLAIVEYSDVPTRNNGLYHLKEDKLPLTQFRQLIEVKPVAKYWPAQR